MASTRKTTTKAKASTPAPVVEAVIAKAEQPAKVEQPAPRAFNPFASAPKLEPTSSKPKAKGKKARDEFEIENLDKDAAFSVLEAVLKAEGDLVHEQVRQDSIEHYVDLMIEQGKKPDSWVGVGEFASASCEIRRRGSNMPIDEETAMALQSKGIPVDKKVRVPERLVLNPEFQNDPSKQHLLQRLADIVAKDPVLSKETIVLNQPEEFSYITSEASLDVLAKTGDRGLIRQFVERLATFAVGKYKFDGMPIESSEKTGDGKVKSVTPEAKAKAIEILQKIGVLPRK